MQGNASGLSLLNRCDSDLLRCSTLLCEVLKNSGELNSPQNKTLFKAKPSSAVPPRYKHLFPLQFCQFSSTQRNSLLNLLHLAKLLQPTLHSVLRFHGLYGGQKTKSITVKLHSTTLCGRVLTVFTTFYFIDYSHIINKNKSLISKSF